MRVILDSRWRKMLEKLINQPDDIRPQLRNASRPAARYTLQATRFTASGRYERKSGHRQLRLLSRQECCPDVCSAQQAAFSGQRVAVQFSVAVAFQE
jgi:hypothetical protein